MKVRKTVAHCGIQNYMKISQFNDVYYSKHISQKQPLPALLHICFFTAPTCF